MKNHKKPINLHSFSNGSHYAILLKPNPFMRRNVQRSTQQYKQDWMVRLKPQEDLDDVRAVMKTGKPKYDVIAKKRNRYEPAFSKVSTTSTLVERLPEKNNDGNDNVDNSSRKLCEKLKELGWWNATRNNDVVHLTRILNEPEFENSRNKLQLLKCYNTHGSNALHIACVSGSFKVVLALIEAGADPLWETLTTKENAFAIAKRYDMTSGKKISLQTLMESFLLNLNAQGDERGKKKKAKKSRKKKKKKY